MKAVLKTKPDAKVLFLAFNVQMMHLLKNKLDLLSLENIDVYTLHAFGLQLLQQKNRHIEIVPDKVFRIWNDLCPSTSINMKQWRELQNSIDRIKHKGVFLQNVQRPLTIVQAIIEKSLEQDHIIDIEDQIYQCLYQKLRVSEYYTDNSKRKQNCLRS